LRFRNRLNLSEPRQEPGSLEVAAPLRPPGEPPKAVRGPVRRHNRALDGVRGVAIALVLLFHIGFLPCGWVGVQLFFVLSGYLITGILVEARSLKPAAYYGRFYWRRTLRIFPLYYAFLLGALVIYWLAGVPQGLASDWPFLFSYTHNLARLRTDDVYTFVHFWSLSVEEQFYFLWPTVVFFTPLKQFRRLLLGLVILVPVARLLVGLYLQGRGASADYAARAVYSLPTSHLDAFAVGAMVTVFDLSWIRHRGRAFIAGLGGLALIGAAYSAFLYFHGGVYWAALGFPHMLQRYYQYAWGYTVLNVMGGLAVLACRDGNALGGWVEARPLRYLGRISYGVYVYHVPILALLVGRWPVGQVSPAGIAATLGYVSIVIAVSALSFELFEKQVLRLKGG
jgi:peptidoglycan/LPS O-acetylase OafA/YrhL